MSENKQEDMAIVKKIEKDHIIVEMIRTDSCKNCALNGMCQSTGKAVMHRIRTEKEFQEGDRIKVQIAPKLRLLSSFLLFIFPILTMILFYLLGKFVLTVSEAFSILISLFGLLCSVVIIYFIDKKFTNKLNLEII